MAEALNYIWVGLAGGAAAFAHCLGMCGPFALHLAGPGSTSSAVPGERGRAAIRQVLWHAGRITTYIFLGTLAGFLGESIVAVEESLRRRGNLLLDEAAHLKDLEMQLLELRIVVLIRVYP